MVEETSQKHFNEAQPKWLDFLTEKYDVLPDSSIFVISSKLQQSMQKYRRRGVCRGRVSDLWRLLYPKVATARVLLYAICRGGKSLCCRCHCCHHVSYTQSDKVNGSKALTFSPNAYCFFYIYKKCVRLWIFSCSYLLPICFYSFAKTEQKRSYY